MLTIYSPSDVSPRLQQVLSAAVCGIENRRISLPQELTQIDGAVLFAFSLNEAGQSLPLYELLYVLRSGKVDLTGKLGGIVIDGQGELYTKEAARDLALAANMAGCALLGRPLVEATGSLGNFAVQAQLLKTDLQGAYTAAVRELAQRLVKPELPPRKKHPKLLVLHAGNRATSNTLDLWQQIKNHLNGFDITEIGLRNGALEDCAGCFYKTCLHFGEQGSCFYGGPMVQQVFPAVKEADGVLLLCPNYNDAVSANISAFINRLTALFRQRRFYDKAVFALVVSGYSGSDLVAEQVIGAMNMNKSFYLPPRSVMMETANDAGAALKLPGIEKRTAAFAENIAAVLQK